MADFDTWVTVLRMEAELRQRTIARRARLGSLPENRAGPIARATAAVRLLLRLLRRPAPALPPTVAPVAAPVCQGRTLPARRPCRVCGARAHGAAAFRPGYRPRRCGRRSERGKSRI